MHNTTPEAITSIIVAATWVLGALASAIDLVIHGGLR